MIDRHKLDRAAKRGLDVVVSGAALFALSPVMSMIALAVRLTMGRPILFRQSRPGLQGEVFEIVKFRTMTEARDADGRLLSNAHRIAHAQPDFLVLSA